MAYVRWSILCAASPTDPETQTLSLHQITDSILVVGLPPGVMQQGGTAIPFNMQLVTMWRRTNLAQPETLETWLSILDPNGQALAEAPGQMVDLGGPNVQFRVTAGIEVLPLRGVGFYTFRLGQRAAGSAYWSLAADVPLFVGEANG